MTRFREGLHTARVNLIEGSKESIIGVASAPKQIWEIVTIKPAGDVPPQDVKAMKALTIFAAVLFATIVLTILGVVIL